MINIVDTSNRPAIGPSDTIRYRQKDEEMKHLYVDEIVERRSDSKIAMARYGLESGIALKPILKYAERFAYGAPEMVMSEAIQIVGESRVSTQLVPKLLEASQIGKSPKEVINPFSANSLHKITTSAQALINNSENPSAEESIVSDGLVEWMGDDYQSLVARTIRLENIVERKKIIGQDITILEAKLRDKDKPLPADRAVFIQAKLDKIKPLSLIKMNEAEGIYGLAELMLRFLGDGEKPETLGLPLSNEERAKLLEPILI